MDSLSFWHELDELAAACPVVIDRPKGSRHPRYPDMIYPYDYGYLEGTQAADGGGIDCWIGSLHARRGAGDPGGPQPGRAVGAAGGTTLSLLPQADLDLVMLRALVKML